MKLCILKLIWFTTTLTLSQSSQDVFQSFDWIDEDIIILKKSIKLFGPPRSQFYENCSYIGPEVIVNDAEKSVPYTYKKDGSGNYILKLRAVTEHFTYNDHYEVGTPKESVDGTIYIVTGQFTEKIKTENGYYLRTIGYIRDEQGYRQFLLDISKVTSVRHKKRKCERKRRAAIPPSALASLVGGVVYAGGGNLDIDC